MNRAWRDFLLEMDKLEEPEEKIDRSLKASSFFDQYIIDHDGFLNEIDDILFEQLLMEGRWDNFKKKYYPKIKNIFMNVEGPEGEELERIATANTELVMRNINMANEKTKHKYTNAVGRLFLDAMANFQSQWTDPGSGKYLSRDALQVSNNLLDAVKVFNDNIKGMKLKDLNQYKTLKQLEDALFDDLSAPRIKKAREERESDKYSHRTKGLYEEGESAIIYEDSRFFVVRPHTRESSCYFGSKTKWCISQTGNSYFKQYTDRDGLVFYFIKDDAKHPDKRYAKAAIQCSGDGDIDGFWDRYDDWHDDLSDLVDDGRYPEEILEEMIEAIEEHLSENPPERNNALEERAEDISRGFEDEEYDNGSKLYFRADYDPYSEDPTMRLEAGLSLVIPFPQTIIDNQLEEEFHDTFIENLEEIFDMKEISDQFGDFSPNRVASGYEQDLDDLISVDNFDDYAENDHHLQISFPIPVPDPSGYSQDPTAWFYNVEQVNDALWNVKHHFDEGLVEELGDMISEVVALYMPGSRSEGYKKIASIIDRIDVGDENIFKNPNINIDYESQRKEFKGDMEKVPIYLSFDVTFMIPLSPLAIRYSKSKERSTARAWASFISSVRNDLAKSSQKKTALYRVFKGVIDKLQVRAVVYAFRQVKIDFPGFDTSDELPQMVASPYFLEPFFSFAEDGKYIKVKFESHFDAPTAKLADVDVAYSFYEYIDNNYEEIDNLFYQNFAKFVSMQIPESARYFDTGGQIDAPEDDATNIEEKIYRVITNLLK